MSDYHPRTPWWMTALIILITVPLLAYPMALSTLPADHEAKTLIWLYPAYVIAAGICAWISYPRRPEITWILIVLMILSHAGVYYLINA